MHQSDSREFAAIMAVLAEVYDDGRPPSALKTDVYFKALSQFTIPELQEAVKNMITTRVYPSFPKPAEIIEAINGKAEDRATRAWIKVIAAVRRYGNYVSVHFDDQVIHSVFKYWGGWGVTATWCEEELKFKQREFEKIYSVMATGNNHPPYIPGDHEIQNRANGWEVKPEILKIVEGEAKRQIAAPLMQEVTRETVTTH